MSQVLEGGMSDAARNLARLVRETREAQRRYFRDRTPAALAESKRLERALDEAAAAVLDPPRPTLFGEERAETAARLAEDD